MGHAPSDNLSLHQPVQSFGRIVGRLYYPAAILLLFAALMKSHQLSTTPLVDNLLLRSRPFNIGLVCLELILAFWLLSGWRARLSRIVTIFVFVVFSIASFEKFLNGSASCACFGVIVMPPLVTFVIDIFIVVCLIAWKPLEHFQKLDRRFVVACLFAIAIAMFGVTRLKSVSLDEIGQTVGDGEVVLIEPETWIGKSLPIIGLLDGDTARLKKNEIAIVLYHEDCPKCQELITMSLAGTKPTAFVELPPYRSPNRPGSEYVSWHKLTDQYQWFVSAPTIIECKDGVVVPVEE